MPLKGAHPPWACKGKVKKVRLWVRRKGEVTITDVLGEGGAGLSVSQVQRVASHVEGFSVFHELLRFI